MTEEMLPPETRGSGGDDGSSSDLPGPRRHRKRWIVGGIISGSLVALVVAAFFVPTPYVAFAPGSVRETEEKIAVDGEQAYASSGEVMFTTVSIKDATLIDLLRGWIDDTVDIKHRGEVYPDGNEEEQQQMNQELMDQSKLEATWVALEYLGFDVQVDGTGAEITGVGEGYPAEGVFEAGDVIVEFEDQPIVVHGDLVDAVGEHSPGDEVTIVYEPADGGDPEEVTLELAARENDPETPVIGITLQTRDLDVQLPFDVDIDSGEVTGPSAGLAWTRAVIDLLTPGDLTDGQMVAVTGTIEPDGSVGPVGGVPQKISAVSRAGIDLFIVPDSLTDEEYERVLDIAGDEVEVKQVGTVDEALEILAPEGLELPAEAA